MHPILRSCLLLAFIIDVTLQQKIKSNETRRVINERDDWGAACNSGSECMLISRCKVPDFLLETIFPCGSENGGTLLICCPINKTAPLELFTTPPTHPITAAPTAITTTTTEAVQKIDSKWSKLPKAFQEKAKLLPSTCGIFDFQNKIGSGNDSDLGQFPWMVLLGYNVNGNISYACGGSLISNRYVLTAAHCTLPSYYPVIARLGEWNISSDNDCIDLKEEAPDCALPVIDMEIEQIIVHERFGDTRFPAYQNDIALLRLKNEVKFTDFVAPVCLGPDIYQSFSVKYTISGWGLTEKNPDIASPILQFALVPHYDFNECNSAALSQYRPLANTQFCAGGEVETSCKGDSGGPLTYLSPVNSRIFQKGIVSLGTSFDCNTDGRPNIYTEVSAYIRWILNKIRK